MAASPRKQSLTSQYFGTDVVGLDDLEVMANDLRLPWGYILESAGLPKSSLSRLKHGAAGTKTTDRVLKAIEEWARKHGKSDEDLSDAAHLVITRINTDPDDVPKGHVHYSRLVIVETRGGCQFLGETYQADEEIARNGSVQLRVYREIGKGVDLLQLSAHGPKDLKQVGPASSSRLLVLDVVAVRECTADARETLRRVTEA